MQIIIEYDSSWRNSFLDGSNNEVLPKKGRKFIGSMASLKQAENFIQREITLDTVMGILNRLIGDQRKLYQARNQPAYYFADIEPLVSFEDKKAVSNNEIMYIRNMTGSTDQNAFTGSIKTDDVIFSSDYSAEFWGVLALDFTELCDFIIDNSPVIKTIQADPLSIIGRLEALKKEKPIINQGKANQAVEFLIEHFAEIKPFNKDEKIFTLPLYCSALYMQLERLSSRFDMRSAKAPRGGISGISKNGFTEKDFMSRFSSGKKTIWGNPYIRKEFINGEGETTLMLTKASGQIEINLNIDKDKAREIETMIENAGVSSFYLGKKGLAYVDSYRI
jgi:hypothetical protein